MLDKITPVILTFNEEANIARTLSKLGWASRIVVVDSFSSDQTEEICHQYDAVDFVQRKFDVHANQWIFAISQSIETPWILALDADYVLSEELINEIKLLREDEINGYWVEFDYLVNGKLLTQSLYPPVMVLYRAAGASYVQDGHAQRVQVKGELGFLKSKIYHDDRKAYGRWLNSQWKYALQEAEKLKNENWASLSAPDKLRKIGVAPILIFPYTLIAKGLIFSGWVGLVYASQRLVAEIALQLARLKKLFTAV